MRRAEMMAAERFSDGPRLLADIGGTNARFALETAPRQFEAIEVLPCSEFPTLGEAAKAYLRGQGLRDAAIAIANPVDGDQVRMTNHTWSFSIEALRRELGLDTLQVVNDFSALAMALPYLDAQQRLQIGGGTELPGRTIGLVGPGTGLGVSAIVPANGHWQALASEGGHASFAPADALEDALLLRLRAEHGHVSAERLLSGPGLEVIYKEVSGQSLGAAAITTGAVEQGDSACLRAVNCFCAILGTVAGNVALTMGATGGMYIGGGIVPRLGELFARSPFRERFEAKGRLRPYVEKIPTFLITEKYPAFLGVAAILAERMDSRPT